MPMTNKQKLNAVKRAKSHLRRAEGFNPNGVHYKAVMATLNKLEAEYAGPSEKKVPRLGPIVQGGASVLAQDCTHITSGLGWPAFDDGFRVGRPVIAPESGVVDDNTSGAAGGDAFYFRGDSGIRYWIGHITKVPAQGTRFAKGATMTTISADHPRPHVHLGIDVRKLTGGKHLISHTNYTHGAPKIGEQLARLMV